MEPRISMFSYRSRGVVETRVVPPLKHASLIPLGGRGMPSPSASFDLDSSSLARVLDFAAPSFSPLGPHAVTGAPVLAPCGDDVVFFCECAPPSLGDGDPVLRLSCARCSPGPYSCLRFPLVRR